MSDQGNPEPNYVQLVLRDLEELLPGCEMRLLDLYAALVLVRGTDTTLTDVHDAWAIWRAGSDPLHRSLVEFDRLSLAVQELDRPYMEAIHAAARRREARLADVTTVP